MGFSAVKTLKILRIGIVKEDVALFCYMEEMVKDFCSIFIFHVVYSKCCSS